VTFDGEGVREVSSRMCPQNPIIVLTTNYKLIGSVRSVGALRNGDEAVGGAGFDALIVRTEVLDVAEAVAREQRVELFTLPTPHHELVIADALIAPPDKFMALGDQEESVFTIELRDTCEGQRSPIG